MKETYTLKEVIRALWYEYRETEKHLAHYGAESLLTKMRCEERMKQIVRIARNFGIDPEILKKDTAESAAEGACE